MVEPSAEFGECLMIKHPPNDTVVEGEVAPFELGDAVISVSVLHIKETEVGQNAHEDGLGMVGELAVVRVSRQTGHEATSTFLEVCAHDILLRVVDAQDSFLKGVVDELFSDETFCYHIAKIMVNIVLGKDSAFHNEESRFTKLSTLKSATNFFLNGSEQLKNHLRHH